MLQDIRLIAFYLPQFHPIPENDAWWGKGFTDWKNVVNAKPLFRGHYQPHLPADLGFYDLRVPEVREAQAELAQEFGIYGFCYYHYWFNGRRLLERPFGDVLALAKPKFPFCLCWANENWTRVWDGGVNEVLLAQKYSREDDLRHIKSLIPALRDERYIRVGGKPLLLVYRTERLPSPQLTADIWRSEAKAAGIGDLYLARVESFDSGINPIAIGFDAAVEFAPDWRNRGMPMQQTGTASWLSTLRLSRNGKRDYTVISYQALLQTMLKKKEPAYKWFRGVTPSWDNSARRTRDALVFHGSTPTDYEFWLKRVVQQTVQKYRGDERIVFVNAWNEWAEGNHLEPDQKWGRGYLESTRRALDEAMSSLQCR